jgi:hypothetical protein
MQLLGWRRIIFIFATTLSLNVFGQQLDAAQMKLINQTAQDICDTVKEQSGKKTEVQLEGDVKAKLSGLAGKLADAGVSGKGTLHAQEFTGLSQEATADALKGDQKCREHIFDKLIDKIGPAPDSKANYQNDERKVDLHTVQQFFSTAPDNVIRIKPEYVCETSEANNHTDEIHIDDALIRIVDRQISDDLECKTGPLFTREENWTCTAAINDTDPILQIWSGPMVQINCLTGKCFKCEIAEKLKNRFHDWQSADHSYELPYAKIYVGNYSDINGIRQTEFNNVLKALSRILSGGSDNAFCSNSPQYCTATSN